jgi:hypothetical protein
MLEGFAPDPQTPAEGKGARNERSVALLTIKTSVNCIIWCNGLLPGCLHLKRRMRWYWWLNTKNVSRRMKRGEAGCADRRQVNRQLQELAPLTRDKRKWGEVDLGSRCEEGWSWEAFQGRRTWLLNMRLFIKSKDRKKLRVTRKATLKYLTNHPVLAV